VTTRAASIAVAVGVTAGARYVAGDFTFRPRGAARRDGSIRSLGPLSAPARDIGTVQPAISFLFSTAFLGVDELPHRAVIERQAALGQLEGLDVVEVDLIRVA
jgi:hypothetical protein